MRLSAHVCVSECVCVCVLREMFQTKVNYIFERRHVSLTRKGEEREKERRAEKRETEDIIRERTTRRFVTEFAGTSFAILSEA